MSASPTPCRGRRSPLTVLPAVLLAALAGCKSAPEPDHGYLRGFDGPAQSGYVRTPDQLLLAYDRVGDGQDVLFVPGGSWLAADVLPLAPGRTLIFFDLRGRSRSDPVADATDISLERDVRDMEALRRFFGFEHISVLAGPGYQAAVGALYAIAYPEQVERLVLLSPLPVRRRPYWDENVAHFSRRLNPDQTAAMEAAHTSGLPRRDPDAWRDLYFRTLWSAWMNDPTNVSKIRGNPLVPPNEDPLRMTAQYEGIIAGLGDWDWRPELRGVKAPTLVVYGTSDPAPEGSAMEWAAAIPGARYQRIGQAGRFPWVERPDVFFHEVGRFLAGEDTRR